MASSIKHRRKYGKPMTSFDGARCVRENNGVSLWCRRNLAMISSMVDRIRTIALIILLADVAALVAIRAVAAEQQPVPDKASQAAASKQVHELFRREFTAAKNSEAKTTLADKLFRLGLQTDDSAEKYVLLDNARRMLIEVGDLDRAVEVVEELAKSFEAGAVPLKIETFKLAAKAAKTDAVKQQLMAAVIDLATEELLSNRLDSAKEAVAVADSVAIRDLASRKAIQDLKARLKQKLAGEAAYKAAVAKLANDPKDEAASLAIGRYLCFAKGDWEQGLPRLTAGGDNKLSDVAMTDSLGGDTPEDMVRVADAWWNLAVGDYATDPDATGIKRRAADWYTKALPGLTGIIKTKAEKRLKEISDTKSAKTLPGSKTDLLAGFDVEKNVVKGKWQKIGTALVCEAESFSRVALGDTPKGDYKLTIVVQAAKPHPTILIGLPIGNGRIGAVLNYNGGCYFESDRGLQTNNKTPVIDGRTAQTIECVVRNNSVVVTVDRTAEIRCNDATGLKWTVPLWDVPGNVVAIVAHGAALKILKVELKGI
jgi:hypothetical protein